MKEFILKGRKPYNNDSCKIRVGEKHLIIEPKLDGAYNKFMISFEQIQRLRQ